MSTRQPDDDYEVQVEADPQPQPPPQRRRRAANPAVDEPIQSGEISVPRSMIVRSQSQPTMAIPPPVEPAPAPAPPAPARRVRVPWLVGGLVAIGGVVALSLVKPPPAAATAPEPVKTGETESTAQLVGVTVDGDARAALMRAEAIASSSMLRAAIETDARTLADMAKDKDIIVPRGPGETVEVFQLVHGERRPMLQLPADAPAIAAQPPGTVRFEQRGDAVFVVADAPINNQAGAVAGDLQLAAPIDLSAVQKRPYTDLSGVMLLGLTKPLSLGGPPAVPRGAPVTAKVTTSIAKGPALSVTAVVPTIAPVDEGASTRATLGYVRIAVAALALFLLLMFGLSFRR